jgi:hypothetical protein
MTYKIPKKEIKMETTRRKMLKKTAIFAVPTIMTFNLKDSQASVSGAPLRSGSQINTQQIETTFNKFFENWQEKEFEGHKKEEWQQDLQGWYSAYLKWSQLKNNKIW